MDEVPAAKSVKISASMTVPDAKDDPAKDAVSTSLTDSGAINEDDPENVAARDNDPPNDPENDDVAEAVTGANDVEALSKAETFEVPVKVAVSTSDTLSGALKDDVPANVTDWGTFRTIVPKKDEVPAAEATSGSWTDSGAEKEDVPLKEETRETEAEVEPIKEEVPT